MAAGTGALGLSGFVFLSVVGHAPLDPAVAAALSSVYLLSNILGPGLFMAVEQETSRRVSATADGLPRGTGTGRAAAVLAAVTIGVLAIAASPLLRGVLGGDAGLLMALAICVIGSAAVFHVRGVLGGRRRFRRYAVGLLVDAAVRIIGVLTLTVLGSRSGIAFALALCIAPGVAALVTRPRRVASADLEGGATGGVARSLTFLMIASLLTMTVANLAPVLVTAASPADPGRAFGFACALVLTRAPLLLVGPMQAMLLPGLAAAAARGERALVRRRLARGLRWTSVLGVVAVAGAAVLGRPAIALLFGAEADRTARLTVALLATSAVLMMAVAVAQPALVALEGHRALVVGWVCGAAVFAASFAGLAGVDPVAAAVTATLAAPAATLAFQLTAIRRL